jgi:hypothetical protein
MTQTPEQIAAEVAAGRLAAELALPVLLPFDPLIRLVSTAILSHLLRAKTWPSEAEIMAALPADYKQLVSDWGAWKPSGDGTLKTS